MLKATCCAAMLYLASALYAQAPAPVPVTIQSATVTLSSAQLLALHANPVLLVAAPGPGQALSPISVIFQYKAGANGYAVTPKSHLLIYLGQAANDVMQISATHFIDQPASQIHMLEGIGGIGISPQSTIENAPILVQNDSSTEWTQGDGSVTVTVHYTVVALQ